MFTSGWVGLALQEGNQLDPYLVGHVSRNNPKTNSEIGEKVGWRGGIQCFICLIHFFVDESSVSLIQINSWAMLNQYLLQNKHASISSFQGRIFKRSRQTTFCLDPSPGFFSYVWLWLTMSICVVWPVSNHHHLIMRSHGHYSPLPPVGPKIWTKAFSSPCLAYPSCTLWTARWGKEAQNLRRTWLFWCNSLFCLRRCWGVMIKHVYQIISVYPIPVDVFWWSSAVCVDSNQVFFLAS